MDIGTAKVRPEGVGGELATAEQFVLKKVQDTIGNDQVTGGNMECAPSWLIHKAMRDEHDNNWADAYEQIMEDDIPRGANFCSSHIVYKVKTEEGGMRKLKGRIFPMGIVIVIRTK